ncbi:MAG: hypothetical protein ACJAT5_000680 [Lentimonas sp.]|jgi:hypothetical protein
MSFKAIIHNKFLSSVVIFSLPFLPFSGLFESKSNGEGSRISEALSGKSDFVSDEVFVPDLIAPGTKIGMWVWQREYLVDPWERILMLDFCRSHGIGSIFVQVHFDKTNEGDYVLANRQEWHELLLMANALGIRVEALDGAGRMAFAVNRVDTISRLKAVLDFHVTQPQGAKFSGIHYDIEPYTTPRWRSGEHQEVATELLNIISELHNIVSETDPSLTFANDIPFWYDGNEKFSINFNGAKKYLNEHIQDISDFIGIMSYRTKMTGGNSISEITSGELAYGAKIGRPVYLSIETIELPDTPHITFHGQSPVAVASAIRELSEALKSDISFGGVFIHEYNTLRLISEQWDLSEINY